MVFTVAPVEGVTIEGVYNGENEITGETNIIIDNANHTVTIKAAYLATQVEGEVPLTIDLSDFTDLTVVVTVIDTTA